MCSPCARPSPTCTAGLPVTDWHTRIGDLIWLPIPSRMFAINSVWLELALTGIDLLA
jgi:hypothetical protein